MTNTLLVGDHLFINKAAYGWRSPFAGKIWIPLGQPQRGDLAVFIFPPDRSKEYIKRVIGLPGDKVQIINKKILINDQLLEMPQAHYEDSQVIPPPQGTKGSPRDNFGPVTVPPEAYFVLGDNQDHSYDSRFWGFVPLELMRGKALYVYFSKDPKAGIRWNRIGLTIN